MTRRLPALARVLLLVAACAPAALAAQVQHLDTRELTLGSDDVVIGQVEQLRAHWNATHTKILTEVTVAVSQTLKGSPADRLTLVQLGGQVDGLRTTVEGGPLFTPGEEVLLFVWRDPQGRAQVNGLGQGKFEITRDPDTGRASVQRALPGLGVREARSLKLVRAGEPAPRIPLEAMVEAIQNVLREGGR